MSLSLKVVLIVISILTCFYIARKLRKSQMNINDTVFWIFFAIILVLLSIFPGIASWGSRLLGFQAPVNFVFVVVIFLLIFRIFIMSIKISIVEDKLRNLTEEIAVRDNMAHKDRKNDQ